MKLKRPPSWRKVYWLAALTCITAALEGAAIWRTLTTADWGGLTGFWAFLGFFGGLFLAPMLLGADVLLLVLLFGLFSLARSQSRLLRLGATFQGEQSPATPAWLRDQQPLADGETLTLRYVRNPDLPGRRRVRLLTQTVVLALMLTAFGELACLALLPALRSALPATIFAFPDLLPRGPGVAPVPLDWLVAATPLWLGFLVILSPAAMWNADHATRVIADDRGVTVVVGRRRAFIAWREIEVFVHDTPKADRTLKTGKVTSRPVDAGTLQGVYWLWGHDQGVSFLLHGRAMAEQQSFAVGMAQRLWVYTGGYEQYAADARRLLATVTARSYRPLVLADSLPRWAAGLRRRIPALTISSTEAELAPLAPDAMQPSTAGMADLLLSGARVRLQRPRRLSIGLLLASLVLFAAIVGVTLVVLNATLPSFASTMSSLLVMERRGDMTGDMTALLIAGFCLLVLAFCWLETYLLLAGIFQRRPVVTGDDIGLHGPFGFGIYAITTTIPWSQVKAWAVVTRHKDRLSAGVTYLVFANGASVAWTEKPLSLHGARRARYQRQAERLHALIAARTRLPLRQITLD